MSGGKKDWDKIVHDLEKEDSGKGEGVDAFFQQIYANATEDQRRAMIKSFQTSGGTVLSTNWDDVKAKNFEGEDRPDIPKGHEWKPYSK